ncbi:MAG: hypothetical protein Q4G43_17160 [Mobilicoccus sp.]|nr:hypothetical protein [Mobilicoccus sp.]
MTSVSIAPTASAVTYPTTVSVRERVTSWADRLHRPGDLVAVRDGLTVHRCGLTGRAYRSPLFDARGGAR